MITWNTINGDDGHPVLCGVTNKETDGIVIFRVLENKVILDGEFTVLELREIVQVMNMNIRNNSLIGEIK